MKNIAMFDLFLRPRLWKWLVSMGVLAMLVGMLSACVTSGEGRLRQNLGDLIIPRLQVGMAHSEVDTAIVDLRKYVTSDVAMGTESEKDVFRWYVMDYYPRDLLRAVEVGTSYRLLSYMTSASSSGSLLLFFDESTKRLRGWVNTPSSFSRDKFMHERLTSKLGFSGDNRLTRSQVYALIGPPSEIVNSERESRATYENHFWSLKGPIVSDSAAQMEVYSYQLASGAKRRVYIAYRYRKDDIMAWGYDHAWEEAERYLRDNMPPK